jgi:Neprosin activation peptide
LTNNIVCINFFFFWHCNQRVPSEVPGLKGDRNRQNYTARSTGQQRKWQAWHHVGRCPKGTVPVRRSSVQDVLRAKSLFHYGKKQVNTVPLARSVDAPDVVSGNGHEVIIYLRVFFI